MIVIASASGGITERIHHGVNGYLFPSGDKKALGKILEQLNPNDLESIRMQAKLDTRDLSPKLFLEQIEALYKELLKED